MRLYHGGLAGCDIGDELTHGPPHVEDGCPICVARAEGKSLTVGEYKRWLAGQARNLGDAGRQRIANVLAELDTAPPWAPMDGPSETPALHVTTSELYARYYAAVRGGDLYRVEPVDELSPSPADSFPTYTTPRARVVEVLGRRVRLTRRERRKLSREWLKADKRKARAEGIVR